MRRGDELARAQISIAMANLARAVASTRKLRQLTKQIQTSEADEPISDTPRTFDPDVKV